MVFDRVNLTLDLVALLSHYADLLARVFQISTTVLDSLLVRHARLRLNVFEFLKCDLFVDRLARVLILLTRTGHSLKHSLFFLLVSLLILSF